ncbi:uncharacterized protein LOC126662069 [Mercurialis annua]|uniref:uncharacterized protein LOC126662069 n=1 Tax=Mercurialis annua TaxID=3986 RepID=UPI00215EA41F|nr:uncharacterized protein LOC126662069 [Mercurialis annua]
MESIPVMIQHKGNWIEANQYADFEVIGVMIPQNSTYLDLLHIIAQEIQVNLEKQNIEIKYQVKIQYPPLKISDDSSFRFYLEIKKKEIDFTMYPLCIVVISDTSQIQTILPDAAASISTAISESNRDQDTISIHDRYMFDTFDEIGQYTKLLAIDTIDCNDDQNQESVSDPLQDIDLTVGKTFKDKATLQACLRLHAINNHYQQKTVKSCQKNIFVKCIDDTCQWYLKASINVHTKQFIIRKQDMNHTCPIETRFSNQKQASASHIAASIKMKYLNVKATYTPVDIRSDMQTLHGVKISYMMAWRSRELAFEMLRGKPCESYKSLPTFLYMLGTRNPGSSIDIQLRDDSTFLYVFTALKASITGWQYCKPIIVVDATFLKATFGGTLLVATAQDAAGKLFPLAFSAVDSENDDSWHYFFTKIKQAFGTREGICIVSDRHLSIESAIKRIYPEATHGVCMFHLLNNLKTNFKRNAKKLKEPFFAAARAYTEVEFDYHMKVLDSLDARVRPFLQQIKYERWSRVHSLKNRYKTMTSNLAESLNAAILHARELPITALFMHLHDLQQEYSYKHRKIAIDTVTTLSTIHEDILLQNYINSLKLQVKPSSDDIITVLENGKKYTVNMVERTCTCKKFDIDEIPCKHAIAFLADKKIEPYAYCSRYYTNAAMLATYSETVYPLEKEEEWIIPEHIKNMIVKPPQHRTRTGRPKKGRYQSKWGNPKNDPNQGQCGKCGHAGHNRKTCRNKPKDT